jgi:hypothetical protein
MGLDTKTYWLTDRQSQCDFDFDVREIRRKKRRSRQFSVWTGILSWFVTVEEKTLVVQ